MNAIKQKLKKAPKSALAIILAVVMVIGTLCQVGLTRALAQEDQTSSESSNATSSTQNNIEPAHEDSYHNRGNSYVETPKVITPNMAPKIESNTDQAVEWESTENVWNAETELEDAITKAQTTLGATGKIRLLSDVHLPNIITILGENALNKAITIFPKDGDYTISMEYAGQYDDVITVNPGASLTIEGSQNHTLILDGTRLSRMFTIGALITNNSGNLTMNDGVIITNHESHLFGSGIIDNEGTFKMTGGKISGNGSESGGVHNGGIFTISGGKISGNTAGEGVRNGGTFTMTGGEITDNKAIFESEDGRKGSGGGVENVSSATPPIAIFTMTGGIISGNTANGDGVANTDSHFCLSGSALIKDTIHLYISNGNCGHIEVLGELTSNEQLFELTFGGYIATYTGTIAREVSPGLINIKKFKIRDDITNRFLWKEGSNLTVECGKPLEECGVYILRNAPTSSKVLDVPGGRTDNIGLQLWEYNGSNAQKFVVTRLDDGTYELTSLNSNKALDVAGASRQNGATVQQYDINKSAAQRWKMVYESGGLYKLQSALKSDLVLDVAGGSIEDGTRVQTYQDNGSGAQRFCLEEDDYEEIVTIRSVLNNNKVLDIPAASIDNGAGLQLYDYNGSNAQKFMVKKEGNYVSLVALNSGKAIDIPGASRQTGTQVQQYEYNGTSAQQWQLISVGDSYILKSKCNNLVLDIAGANTQNGTRVQVYSQNNTNAQRFIFDVI